MKLCDKSETVDENDGINLLSVDENDGINISAVELRDKSDKTPAEKVSSGCEPLSNELIIKKQKNKRKILDNLQGILFASSPLIGFLLFGFIPLVISLILSFGKLRTFDLRDMQPVKFENYIRIFTEDDKFFKSVGNTFVYAFFTVFISIALSLVLASFLNRKIAFKKGFRMILFLPYICSAVAISTMWKWVFEYNYGILNTIMDFFHAERINWLGDVRTAMPVMIMTSVWGGLGFNMILYSAALSAINKSYYEAAMLDGASSLKVFFTITFPLVSPTTFYLAVMGFIGALQSFANFQIMTPNGGPENSTLTMVFRVWDIAFNLDKRTYGMGYAAAMSWLVGLIIMVFTAINFGLSKRWVHYD